MLVAIFCDAIETLRDNKSRADVILAIEFINEKNNLFVALAHLLDTEPDSLKNKVLDNIKEKTESCLEKLELFEVYFREAEKAAEELR